MNEQEIKALLEAHTSKLMETLNTTVNGAVARLSKETDSRFSTLQAEPKDPQKDESNLQFQTLKQELEQIKLERDKDKKTAHSLRRENALNESISSLKVLSPKTFKKMISAEYGDSIVEEDGSWYLKEGDAVKPLSDALVQYLSSEDGQLFKSASGVTGTGSKAGDQKTSIPETESLSSLFTQKLQKKRK